MPMYPDIDRSAVGIGFHGDTERRLVIGVRLGHASSFMPLYYQWFHRHKAVGDPYAIQLNHGDVYFMSEKATGYHWRLSSQVTLRHGTGRKAVLKRRRNP